MNLITFERFQWIRLAMDCYLQVAMVGLGIIKFQIVYIHDWINKCRIDELYFNLGAAVWMLVGRVKFVRSGHQFSVYGKWFFVDQKAAAVLYNFCKYLEGEILCTSMIAASAARLTVWVRIDVNIRQATKSVGSVILWISIKYLNIFCTVRHYTRRNSICVFDWFE